MNINSTIILGLAALSFSCEPPAENHTFKIIGESEIDGVLNSANAASGSFSLLIYNIAGLPSPVSSSNPVENTPLIGPKLDKYDIVLLQEDFWYHNRLRVSLPFQSEPQALVPSVFDLHDGLNRFSKFSFHELSRHAWQACAGYLTDSCDCLASKGFSSARMTIGEGTSILVYNVHMDAGQSDTDVDARKFQFRQLADDIKRKAEGEAIIVAGDVNLESQSPQDLANFNEFLLETGLKDSCDKFRCEGELFDKVLIRSSDSFEFTMKSRTSPEFLCEANEELSDHKPVAIILDWKKTVQ